MPKVAVGLGGAEVVCDLDAIVAQVLTFLPPVR